MALQQVVPTNAVMVSVDGKTRITGQQYNALPASEQGKYFTEAEYNKLVSGTGSVGTGMPGMPTSGTPSTSVFQTLPGGGGTAAPAAGGINWGDILKYGLPVVAGAASGFLNQSNSNKDRRQSADQFNQSLAERKNEFERTQDQSEGHDAISAQRAIETSPLRDQAIYMLQKRAQSPPTPYQPRDPLNPHATPQGAASDPHGGLAANAAAAASYTPGAGGVDTSIYQALIDKYRSGKVGGKVVV
jgi:hypothetical protein